jgi:hypothetical protein
MPCVACTYMPNASWRRRGSKVQGRGLPTLGEGAEGGTERAERSGGLHKRSAEDWGNPCTARGRALRKVWFPHLRWSERMNLVGWRYWQEEAVKRLPSPPPQQTSDDRPGSIENPRSAWLFRHFSAKLLARTLLRKRFIDTLSREQVYELADRASDSKTNASYEHLQ